MAFAPLAWAAGAVNNCTEAGLKAALVGGGDVTFNCSGTITVLGGTIDVSDSVTIDGSGRSVIISGASAGQIFKVYKGGNLTLRNLNVIDGNVPISISTGLGGAIFNDGGEVVVDHCSFENNAAGNDGGAIDTDGGGLQVKNSTFINNIAEVQGGAISVRNGAAADVTASTFSQNNGKLGGGAIFNAYGDLYIRNSTFYKNSAGGGGGGILSEYGEYVTVNNSTFLDGESSATEPGGNLQTVGPGAFVLQNTILGGAIGGPNCGGVFADGGGNLRWPPDDPSCVGSYGDPKLSTLANNGGPTPTLALGAGSAALHTGIEALCPPTDQRGVQRPQGPQCEIGAYESASGLTLTGGVLQAFQALLPDLVLAGARRTLTAQAITPLRAAMNPELWTGTDGNHLNPQLGAGLFTQQATVAGNLSALVVDEEQLDYLNNLTMSARTVAATAISDAKCTAGTTAPPNCAPAKQFLAQGDKNAAAGNFSAAINSYQSAWIVITAVRQRRRCRAGRRTFRRMPARGKATQVSAREEALIQGSQKLSKCRRTCMHSATANPQSSFGKLGGQLFRMMLLLSTALGATVPARAAGVVNSCNEAGLKAALVGGGTVTFNCSGTIAVLGGTINVSGSVTVDGTSQQVTLSGGGAEQIFYVNQGASLTLRNLTVADGFVPENPGYGGGDFGRQERHARHRPMQFSEQPRFLWRRGHFPGARKLVNHRQYFRRQPSGGRSCGYLRHQ